MESSQGLLQDRAPSEDERRLFDGKSFEHSEIVGFNLEAL